MLKTTLALVLLLLMMPIYHAQAQTACYRVEVTFTADEDTNLSGKVSTYWKTRVQSGFVDFELDPLFDDDDDDISSGTTIDIGSYTLEGARPSVEINDSEAEGDGDFDVRVVDCDAPKFRAINDGRLNANDLAAPAAIYPTDDGYAIYVINPATGNGARVLDVTNAQISAALATATSTRTNTQIGAFQGVSLWALSSNECQMNAFGADGKLFEFIFSCAADE